MSRTLTEEELETHRLWSLQIYLIRQAARMEEQNSRPLLARAPEKVSSAQAVWRTSGSKDTRELKKKMIKMKKKDRTNILLRVNL